MKKKIRLLWVTDPWDTLDHEKDTTLRLIEEALLMGAECSIAENRTISIIGGEPQAEVRRISNIARPRSRSNIKRTTPIWVGLSSFHHIFYRVDPPVDLSYLLPLQILAKAKGKVHSPPSTLFSMNEKWAPVELGTLFPRSLVSASPGKLKEFLKKEKKVVLKPLFQAQSKGVMVLDSKSRSSLELAKATNGGTIPVILQKYLPEISKGETRLWFVNGLLIASVRKLPKAGESIINMDQGGSIAMSELTTAEKHAVLAIGKFLKKNKILWAAVDLIAGKITDFNHTSPGLLVAMEELLSKNLARAALKPVLR